MNIPEHRKAIDRLDAKIVKLLNERTQHVLEIGAIKLKAGEEIYAPHRELAVLQRVCRLNQGPITNEAIRAIYREIMSSALSLQKTMRIAYLSPEATFTHQAAIRRFGSSLRYFPQKTINARSAELAAREKGSAAIAGQLAAEKYGLSALESDIQDNAANATRFLVLGRQCSPTTGHDRTSLMISLVDKVGALHRALAAFRRYRINMTKIESRPSKRKAWEYFFFIDCDGHVSDHKVAKAIGELEQQCSFVKVLGSYPNAE